MTTVAKAKAKLDKSLVTMSLLGIRTGPNHWFKQKEENEPTRVCLCGALLVATGVVTKKMIDTEEDHFTGAEIIREVSKKLGCTLNQAASLNDGFEGYPIKGDEFDWKSEFPNFVRDNAFHRLGWQYRKMYDKGVNAQV